MRYEEVLRVVHNAPGCVHRIGRQCAVGEHPSTARMLSTTDDGGANFLTGLQLSFPGPTRVSLLSRENVAEFSRTNDNPAQV